MQLTMSRGQNKHTFGCEWLARSNTVLTRGAEGDKKLVGYARRRLMLNHFGRGFNSRHLHL